MGKAKATILVADDEEFNQEILVENLEDAGYLPVVAGDGRQAWRLLEDQPTRFDAVLLDRMMPHMDGMEVLARIKAHPDLNTLPIIMQTAKAAKEDVLEGLRAGAYYYLTKPFGKETMLAIVATAVADYGRYRELQREVACTVHTLTLMEQGHFSFRTLGEAQALASLLSYTSPGERRLVIGLSELFLNAVEHGNLGIGYEEKTRLVGQERWLPEVERRLALPENRHKCVRVEYCHRGYEHSFLIRDQGQGFDWHRYLEIAPERAFDNHGRGIAMALALSFDTLEYRGEGNEVLATVKTG